MHAGTSCAARRACYGVLRFVMESGAKGCEVIVSGKLRAQRAKSMKFKDGYMVSSGESARTYIDRAVRHVLLRQGVLGIKVRRGGALTVGWGGAGHRAGKAGLGRRAAPLGGGRSGYAAAAAEASSSSTAEELQQVEGPSLCRGAPSCSGAALWRASGAGGRWAQHHVVEPLWGAQWPRQQPSGASPLSAAAGQQPPAGWQRGVRASCGYVRGRSH